jgi:hypothetical protein
MEALMLEIYFIVLKIIRLMRGVFRDVGRCDSDLERQLRRAIMRTQSAKSTRQGDSVLDCDVFALYDDAFDEEADESLAAFEVQVGETVL